MSAQEDKFAGKAKQVAGDATNNQDLKDEGRAQELKGKATDLFNTMKDKAQDLADDARNKADDLKK